MISLANSGTFFPTVDLTKNVCELINANLAIATTYDYTPFGSVTISGTHSSPFQFSSEFTDSELDLVYYNYRHYNPTDGRWLSRDKISEKFVKICYLFTRNLLINRFDILGLYDYCNLPYGVFGISQEEAARLCHEQQWKRLQEDARSQLPSLSATIGMSGVAHFPIKGFAGGISLEISGTITKGPCCLNKTWHSYTETQTLIKVGIYEGVASPASLKPLETINIEKAECPTPKDTSFSLNITITFKVVGVFWDCVYSFKTDEWDCPYGIDLTDPKVTFGVSGGGTWESVSVE